MFLRILMKKNTLFHNNRLNTFQWKRVANVVSCVVVAKQNGTFIYRFFGLPIEYKQTILASYHNFDVGEMSI